MGQQWSNPVPLKEYVGRIDARLDASNPEVRRFRAYIIGLCNGFRCAKHPAEAPSIEYTRDHSNYRSACAACRGAS